MQLFSDGKSKTMTHVSSVHIYNQFNCIYRLMSGFENMAQE